MPALNDLLRALKPNGPDGLEGLVATVLSDALDLAPALPVRSGNQAGRDVGLFSRDGRRVPFDIEVKRYTTQAPDERMLLGELTQARRARPDTQVWFLVSTYPMPTSTVEALHEEAFAHGFDVVVLDCADGSIATFDLLAASRRDLVLHWLRHHKIRGIRSWQAALDRIACHPAYAVMLPHLPQRLASRYTPAQARTQAKRWLAGHVQGRRQHIAGLNQSLGRTGRAPAVPRPEHEKQWQAWLNVRASKTRLLALLGGEGDGKTWTAIDMLLADPDRTPLVATSNMFDDGGAVSLVAEVLAQQCGGDADQWRDRLTRRESIPRDFRFLLLLDGLNEAAPRIGISRLIEELLADGPWSGALDVIVTCRQPFWEYRVEPYLTHREDAIDLLHIGPFHRDTEWPVARAHLGPAAAGFTPEMVDALRNPRLWSFAYELRDQLGGIGEITLERLLVEHWRLREAERTGLGVGGLEFNRLIAHAADELIDKTRAGTRPLPIESGTLQAWIERIAGSGDYTTALGEIRDGVFFSSSTDFRLLLRKERVPVALGLLLAGRAIAAFDAAGTDAALRITGAFMQDLPASDRVEIILRTAVFCVLALPARPPRLLAPLLRHWVGLQNAEHDFYRALSIVVAAAPEACIQAIEDDASEDEFVGDAAPDLCTALVGRRDKPKVEAALAMAAREWLRSYSAEHFSEIGRLGFEGLVASPVIWVETLVDYAAKFLAALSHAHWPLSLGYWARCRLAHTAAREEAYAYDEDMRYLGAAMGLTDAIAAEVLAVASSQTNPKLTDEEVDLVSRLLNGQVYAELSLRYTQELAPKRPPEIELQVREKFAAGPRPDTFDYSELYRDESATGSEPWLHVESTILETAPNRLAAIVQDLARQALDAAAAARAGGLAHFVRDHALLLGVIAVELVHVHSRKPGTDNQIGRACGGLFAAIAPERQFAALTGVSDLANIKRLDVTGISASIPKSVLNEAARGQLDDPARAFALALVLAEGSGPMVLEEGQIVSKLLRHKHDSVRNMIPRLIRRRGNVADAKIVTLYYPTIAGCHSKTAKEVSTLLLRGAWPPRYSDLRFRLRPNDWPAAAHMDGSGAAIALFVTDLHGLLRSVLGDAWPHAAPSDFATLAAYAPYGSRTAGMTLDLPAAREAVRLLTSSAPAALTAIRKGLEGLAPNTLARADQHLRLATALALQGPMKETARWFNRLLANDHAVADHKGLSVERPKVMLFKDDRPEIVALRNELAARAWTDHDILQLVCLAQLEGRDAWLDEWIAREAQQPERCRRVRGILLRGWRADDDDLAWLADLAAPTGFEAFAADTALAWARRRRRLHEEMLRFMKAGSEADAWLASRWMAHLGDRRVLVEARRLRWPGVLSPQRRAAFEQSKANFERQFLMLEGNLKQKFAGVTPPTFAPWSEVMIYNSPA